MGFVHCDDIFEWQQQLVLRDDASEIFQDIREREGKKGEKEREGGKRRTT